MEQDFVVQTRVDTAIKDEATAVLERMGLTVSDAMRLMLVRVAREKTLPFAVFNPKDETIAAMQDARAGVLETVTLADLQAVSVRNIKQTGQFRRDLKRETKGLHRAVLAEELSGSSPRLQRTFRLLKNIATMR